LVSCEEKEKGGGKRERGRKEKREVGENRGERGTHSIK
jgi:hypothetical protein